MTERKNLFWRTALCLLVLVLLSAAALPVQVWAADENSGGDEPVVEEPADDGEIVDDEEPTDDEEPVDDEEAVDNGDEALALTAENGEKSSEETTEETTEAAKTPTGSAYLVSDDPETEWSYYENNDSGNAIQQAVQAAIDAGRESITVVVQDGTYSGGIKIDNSGTDENGNEKKSLVVNIVAHDAYESERSPEDTADAVYPIPTDADGNLQVNSNSAGGVKLEDGVSVKNVELLLAGLYLSLKDTKNQGKVEELLGDGSGTSRDVVVEDAESFTFYGTAQDDTAKLKLKDVENAQVQTGDGSDNITVDVTLSPDVELDPDKTDEELKTEIDNAETGAGSNVIIDTGAGDDKVTVKQNNKVTEKDSKHYISKAPAKVTVEAGDGADTITLKGGNNLMDHYMEESPEDALIKRIHEIAATALADFVGSSAAVSGGAGDDLMNVETSWDLGSFGSAAVDFDGGAGHNRLHLSGSLQDKNISGSVDETGAGSISLMARNTIKKSEYRFIDGIAIPVNEVVKECTLAGKSLMVVTVKDVKSLTDALGGKKQVEATIENGKVMVNGAEADFQIFTDYVVELGDDVIPGFTNTSGSGLLTNLILKGQHLEMGQGVSIVLPNATLVLEAKDSESSSITVKGSIEAGNILIRLNSTDSNRFTISDKDDSEHSIISVLNDVRVVIESTARLIATHTVEILAKCTQTKGLIPSFEDLIPGLQDVNDNKLADFITEKLGFTALKDMQEASSLNVISVKLATSVIEIMGDIIAGSLRAVAGSTVETSTTNKAVRDFGLPLSIGIVTGEAGVQIGDEASIETTYDMYLEAESKVDVATEAQSGRLPFTLAVTVVDNKAYVDITDNCVLKSTEGSVIAHANGTVKMNTVSTGSNDMPESDVVVPSTDNEASNTQTVLDKGKSGGFFAISVLNQDVFAAIREAASVTAGKDIEIKSAAKAAVTNSATSNPKEGGDSMTLSRLIKILTFNEDTGILDKVKGFFEKDTGAESQEEQARAAEERAKNKKQNAIGNLIDKLTGKGEKEDGVASLVDQATSSANPNGGDSTHTMQLVGALAVTYADNDNRAYIETTGKVEQQGTLRVLANGEMSVSTLADGSPVKRDDPGAADKDGKNKTGPQDEHYSAHSHGDINVQKLTNGTIIIDAALKPRVKDTFDFAVKASFGYRLAEDENGNYYIENTHKDAATGKDVTEKIFVDFDKVDENGNHWYKGQYTVAVKDNKFKASFVTKDHAVTVKPFDNALGSYQVLDAEEDGKDVYFADQGETLYLKVKVKSGVNFAAPYILCGNTPINVSLLKETTDSKTGAKELWYKFDLKEAKDKDALSIDLPFVGSDMTVKYDESAHRGADVWFAAADAEPSGDPMTSYTGKVGDKIKIVIQLPNATYMVANSLMFAGKTPVYIKDITYDGENQYTCLVNIPAILKTEGDTGATPELNLVFQTTLDEKEAQQTIKNTGTALGAGLAVDVTRYNNQAYITKTQSNVLGGQGVEVKANTSALSASAQSKAGFVAADLGVAGAITVHLVSANNEAQVGGSVTEIASNGGSVKLESVVKNSNIVTKALAAGSGAKGVETKPDSTGVGAGIAVGVSNISVAAKILDTVKLSGGLKDLVINAGHSGKEEVAASAGASGGTSAVPVLAMNISGVSVLADSGKWLNNTVKLSGDALISSANTVIRSITADAAAVGHGVGVGASFIIDVLKDSAKSRLGRSVQAGGRVSVTADSVSRLTAKAKSGAQGSVSGESKPADGSSSGGGSSGSSSGSGDKEDHPSVDLPDDCYGGLDDLFGDGTSDDEELSEEDAEFIAHLFDDGKADAFVDSNKGAATGLASKVENNNGNVTAASVNDAFVNRQKAETSEGSVQVAATMVLNIQSNEAHACIEKVAFVESGADITVTSRHDTDAEIMADASATKSTTGVGVGVAINMVDYSNVAEVLTNKLTAVKDVVIRADIYENKKEETAKGVIDALVSDAKSLQEFAELVIAAAIGKEGQTDALKKYVVDHLSRYAAEESKKLSEEDKNAIGALIVQWIGELIKGGTPSFPTKEQENAIKDQVVKYAMDVYKDIKKNISLKKIFSVTLGSDGLWGKVKETYKDIKNINLKQQATNAAFSYLAGKLGADEEPKNMGPRISTGAVSGAGASNVGVAGSVAISVVNGESYARLGSEDSSAGTLTAGGSVIVVSKAGQDVCTSAGSAVTALGRVDKNSAETTTAGSGNSGNASADSGKSVGVGAAVAMSFADLVSDAIVSKGWTIEAVDFQLEADARNNVETVSVAGTDPLARTDGPATEVEDDSKLTEEEKKKKEEEKKKADEAKAAKAMDYAVDASVAVTLIQNTVNARLLADTVLNLSRNLSMNAAQSGTTATNASGFAMGNDTAVGAAVAINLAFSDVLAEFLGSGTVGGNAVINANTENQDDANALALAMGADMDRYFAKLRGAEKVMAFNKKADAKDKVKQDNDTSKKVNDKLNKAAATAGTTDNKSNSTQPLSVQAIKSQNVKTENTNQTDPNQAGSVGNAVTNAAGSNAGGAVSNAMSNQAQPGQEIHVAAAVGVNVTAHNAKTVIGGNLSAAGIGSNVENTGNFSTIATGAAISSGANSNCIGAAVAVSVNGNKAQIVVPDGIKLTVTGAAQTGSEIKDPIVGNLALRTALNQNSTGDYPARYGAVSVAGSSGGRGGKVGLAGSMAIVKAVGESSIVLGDNVVIRIANGDASIEASDRSKLSAAAMAATKSGAAVGVGASFALLYAENRVFAEAGRNLSAEAKNFEMKAVKEAIDIGDFTTGSSIKEIITLIEVNKKGDNAYKPENADKYGMIVVQKNKNGTYSAFTNFDAQDIQKLIEWTSVLAYVNYYASAVAGTVMERTPDATGQKAAVAGAVSMLFNDSYTAVKLGEGAKIKTTGNVKLDASSETNTRLLGGALSSSSAKTGIGLNVATASQNDLVDVIIGANAGIIAGEELSIRANSLADMLVITAAASSASGTSVGGGLNVVINNSGAKVDIGEKAIVQAAGSVDIGADSKAQTVLGSLAVSVSGSEPGASAGAILSVTQNDSYAKVLVADSVEIISDAGSVTLGSSNDELVVAVMAAAARSGNGGAGAGTLNILTTGGKSVVSIDDNASIIAFTDVKLSAVSKARLVDLMLAAAASTSAPAAGATVMVNIFDRETGVSLGDGCTAISSSGCVHITADAEEKALIVSVAGAAGSETSLSGNIQVNLGDSHTYATVGDNARIYAWDSIGVTADHDSTAIAIGADVTLSTGGTAVGATVQTTLLENCVEALIGKNAQLVAYAQDSVTNGIQTSNREEKRKGIILSALARDMVTAVGISAGAAGGTGVSGVLETLVMRNSAIAKLGSGSAVRVGFKSGDSVVSELSGSGSPADKEGELSAEADADSTVVVFGGGMSITTGTGVGATVLTVAFDKTVEAELLPDEAVVRGGVNVTADAEDYLALVAVNFGISSGALSVGAGGNVLVFENKVSADLFGNVEASGDVNVLANSRATLNNAVASLQGSVQNPAVSGEVLVTYFRGETLATVCKGSEIRCAALNVLADSQEDIFVNGTGITASLGSAAASGIVIVIVSEGLTRACIESGTADNYSSIIGENVAVIAMDHYTLEAVAVSLAAANLTGIGVTAVVTVAHNTVSAYVGDFARLTVSGSLDVNALSQRDIGNYAAGATGGSTAAAGVTVMVAAIGGKLDPDSANGIAKGFKPDAFMSGMSASVPDAAQEYLADKDLAAALEAEGSKASDLSVGENGSYSGAEDYRSEDFNSSYNAGSNPGENVPDDLDNRDGAELGVDKPGGESLNVVEAFIGGNCVVNGGEILVLAEEILNIDIVTASASAGGTAGVNAGVAVVVAYSNVTAAIRPGTKLNNVLKVTVSANSGGTGIEDAAAANAALNKAGFDVDASGSSIRAIAISVAGSGTAAVSPAVAVVNMASKAIATMDGVSGVTAEDSIHVAAGMTYPAVLAVTGSIGAGGTAGVSASVAVVAFNSETYAGIINGGSYTAGSINVTTEVDNTARAFAATLAAGGVGVNGGVAVVANRSTTKALMQDGSFRSDENVRLHSKVNTAAEAYIASMAAGGTTVGLNAAVVNQAADILTALIGSGTGSIVCKNVEVSNDIQADASALVIAVGAGGVSVGGNVLLVFNDLNAEASVTDMNTTADELTVSSVVRANSKALLTSATVGGVAVGLSTSYVGLNARNLALYHCGSAVENVLKKLSVNTNGSEFHASAATVAGSAGQVSVGLNAAVADNKVSNVARIDHSGRLLADNVTVSADSQSTALAEIYFVSLGGVNASAATAVALLRSSQRAEASIQESADTAGGSKQKLQVTSLLNQGMSTAPATALLHTASVGIYNAAVNVAVAHGLSESIAELTLRKGSLASLDVKSNGSGSVHSATESQTLGACNGSVNTNLAYAKGRFHAIINLPEGAEVSVTGSTNVSTDSSSAATAKVIPAASGISFSIGSFNVNLAIARMAVESLAALKGAGTLNTGGLTVHADAGESRARADVEGVKAQADGVTFGVARARSLMELCQKALLEDVTVKARSVIVIADANGIESHSEVGSSGGVKASIVGGSYNSAEAVIDALNEVVVRNAMVNAAYGIIFRSASDAAAAIAKAKAPDVNFSGVNTAASSTNAYVKRLHTTVTLSGSKISAGGAVRGEASANDTEVTAQSIVPRLDGSLISGEAIEATAHIGDKLTQIFISGSSIDAAGDVVMDVRSSAAMKADSAHPAVSAGVIAVKGYHYLALVDKIAAVIDFAGSIKSGGKVTLNAYDLVKANVTMDDETIGAYTGNKTSAKINVREQTVRINTNGSIQANGDLTIRAKGDQKLRCTADNSSVNFTEGGSAKLSIDLVRKALVDIKGKLISETGRVTAEALLAERQEHSNDGVTNIVFVELIVSNDTWIDNADIPTTNARVDSTATVTVGEGSLIQSFFGDLTLRARAAGNVQARTYRYVDKIAGSVKTDANATVREIVRVIIGKNAATTVEGKNVYIKALSETDVRTRSEAHANTWTGSYKPHATTILCSDLDVLVYGAEISAVENMEIGAYMPYLLAKAHAKTTEEWTGIEKPKAYVEGHFYGDVSFDAWTVLRAYMLTVKAFEPADKSCEVKVERLEDEDGQTRRNYFYTHSDETANKWKKGGSTWTDYENSKKFQTGNYTAGSDIVRYSGAIRWSVGGGTPSINNLASNQTEVYVGGGAAGVFVDISKDYVVSIQGFASQILPEDVVELRDGVYHVLGEKIEALAGRGEFYTKSYASLNSYKLNTDQADCDLTLYNRSDRTVQLDKVNEREDHTMEKNGASHLVVRQDEPAADLILSGSGEFKNGTIHIELAGGDLILRDGAVIDGNRIHITGVGSLVDEVSEDGRIHISNSSVREVTGKILGFITTYTDHFADLELEVEDDLNLVIHTKDADYSGIRKITSGGDIVLEVAGGDSAAKTVTLGSVEGSGLVHIKTPGSLQGDSSQQSNVSGNTLKLEAAGAIGSADKPLRIDSNVNGSGEVYAKASGGISLKEVAGDLHIRSIVNKDKGNVALYTENGSLYLANDALSDYIQILDELVVKGAEAQVQMNILKQLIDVLLLYMEDMQQIKDSLVSGSAERAALQEQLDQAKKQLNDLLQDSVTANEDAIAQQQAMVKQLETELANAGANLEAVLSAGMRKIDILHYVSNVGEALTELERAMLYVAGDIQDLGELKKLYNSASIMDSNGFFDEEFQQSMDSIEYGSLDAGQIGRYLLDWYRNALRWERFVRSAIAHMEVMDELPVEEKAHIISAGDLLLHLRSASGKAVVSEAHETLGIAIGGKLSITTAANTVLTHVYVESYEALKLDPITATDVIDIHSMNGIYAAQKGDGILLNADSLIVRSLMQGDLGTADQPLITKVNKIDGVGTNVHVVNRKSLLVDFLMSLGHLDLKVEGNLGDCAYGDVILGGIHGMTADLNVSGDIGGFSAAEGYSFYVSINVERDLNITAKNLYMESSGTVRVGQIRIADVSSIATNDGAVYNAGSNSGIWCDELDLRAYGEIGTIESPLLIYSDSVYSSSGGGLLLAAGLYSAAPRGGLVADSVLYGENVRVIPVSGDESASGTGMSVVTDSGETGIRVSGNFGPDAALEISYEAPHINCLTCEWLKRLNAEENLYFVCIRLLGEYSGELLVEIPAAGKLMAAEGEEVIILTCREGVVYAIRARVVNGYICFNCDELGPFLILQDESEMMISEDGKLIAYGEQEEMLPFGGWLS